MPPNRPIVVAGHICLDLIPTFPSRESHTLTALPPGTLFNVGPAVMSTGGAVANTGIALHKLGAGVRLVGKVGDDPFGRVVLDTLNGVTPSLTEHMVVDPASHTSYTVVINPPGIDRVFLHHPGANDTFGPEDLGPEHLEGACLMHFGYPPLMRRMFADGGGELRRVFDQARRAGLATSLDLSMPDPESESGKADWVAILRAALPHVDFFLPSLEEILMMLGWHEEKPSRDLLVRVTDWALESGAACVGIKMGHWGVYFRSTGDPERLSFLGRLGASDPGSWRGRELLMPCYKTRVVGTTGAGDCTIAGFLAAAADGGSPLEALSFAAATGAFNVESPDATGGIPDRQVLLERLRRGWQKLDVASELGEWTPIDSAGPLAGSRDRLHGTPG